MRSDSMMGWGFAALVLVGCARLDWSSEVVQLESESCPEHSLSLGDGSALVLFESETRPPSVVQLSTGGVAREEFTPDQGCALHWESGASAEGEAALGCLIDTHVYLRTAMGEWSRRELPEGLVLSGVHAGEGAVWISATPSGTESAGVLLTPRDGQWHREELTGVPFSLGGRLFVATPNLEDAAEIQVRREDRWQSAQSELSLAAVRALARMAPWHAVPTGVVGASRAPDGTAVLTHLDPETGATRTLAQAPASVLSITSGNDGAVLWTSRRTRMGACGGFSGRRDCVYDDGMSLHAWAMEQAHVVDSELPLPDDVAGDVLVSIDGQPWFVGCGEVARIDPLP